MVGRVGYDRGSPDLQPPAAQQIYAVLDTAMQGVLTDRNADIGKLLSDAEKQVNQILSALPT